MIPVNQSEIARRLGVHRSTVMRRLRQGRSLDDLKPGNPRPEKQGSKIDRELLETLARSGMTRNEIAEEIGVGPTTIGVAAAKHGIKLFTKAGRIKTIKDNVQDMKAVDAVEYLLHIVEELIGGDDDFDACVEAGMPSPLIKTYLALKKASPRTLTHEQLLVIASADSANLALVGIVKTKISQLRKVLGPDETIHTVWGVGYRMEIKQSFRR